MNPLPDELRDIPPDVLALVSAQIAKSYKALPVKLRGRKLVIAVADAGEVRTLRAIQFATEREVEALVVSGDALAAAIEHYYGERRPEAKPPQLGAAIAAPAAEPSFFDELSDSLVDESLLAPDLAPEAAVLDDFGLDDLGSLDDLVAPEMAPALSPAPAKPLTPPVPPAARPAAPVAPVPPPVQRPVQIEVAAVDAARLDKVDPAAVALLSSDTARNYHALPIELDEKTVTVAFAEPPDAKALRAIQYAVGRMVRPVAAPRAALDAAILLH